MTSHRDPTHIVGIGASAGGLAALEEFFKAMPADSGMAFVMVQHLSPDISGLMDDLLARHTTMPVQRLENGMALTANAIFLIPPRQVMTVTEGHRHLQQQTGPHLILPIDSFFESLAGAAQHKAIGIILSGAGSDGARGIQAIHAAGGLVLVQSMESAQFDGMPRAAINTGMYDCIAAPAAMPALLLEYAKDPGGVRVAADDLIVEWHEGAYAAGEQSPRRSDDPDPIHASALLDAQYQVLHYMGAIGQYLKTPPTLAATDFTRFVVDDLHQALSVALQGAATLKGRVSVSDIAVKQGETARRVDLDVEYIPHTRADTFHYRVLLTPVKEPGAHSSPTEQIDANSALRRAAHIAGEHAQVQPVRTDDAARIRESAQSMEAERNRLAERLQLAARAAGIGIWDWDIQNNEIVWDDQMYALYGLQPGEFGGAYAAWLQGVHPDDRERSDEISARAVRGEAEYDTDFRVLWPDRSVHWLKATGMVFRDRAGTPVRMVGVNYDITERKETEQELKRWADIFQNVTFGFVVGSPEDPYLGIMNPAFARMHGYSMDELIGRPIASVFAPEDRAELPEHIRLAHETGHHAWEARHLRKDGTVFPVIVDAVAVKDGDGKVLYRIVSVQDITERRRAEEIHARLVERLNLATHSAQIGIWDWDIQQDELIWDDQMYALYGLHSGEFGGAYEAWLNGVHPDDRERSEEATARAVDGKAAYDTEFRVMWPDGAVHWLKADGEVFRDQDGKPTRMVGANYDITERKELEDSLRDSERKYSLLFEKSTVPTVLLKLPEVVIANANEACEKLTGFTRGEMIGKTSVELGLARKEVREETIADFGQMGALVENEIPLFTKSGDLRIVIANTMPVKMSDGMYAITTMQDITARKQAEESVRIALAKYQTLFDTFPLGITVSDADGNIIETNRIAEELLGIGEEEQQQRKIDGAEWQIIRPDATPMPAEEFASVRALKAAKRVENVEMGIVKPDGEVTWSNVSAAPLPVEGYGVVVTYSDITKRKQAESALQRSEKLLSETGRIAKIGGWELDIATMKQVWTDATYDIHDRERGVYDPNSTEELSRFEPGSKERIENAFAEAIRQGTPYDLEAEMTTVKGNRKWVRAVCSPILVDGKVTRLAGTVQDITERKTMEQQSQESERNYRELVQNANSAIIRWRGDGTIAFFNEYAQRLFGYRSAEILGKPIGILVPATDSSGSDLSSLVQNIVDHPDDFVNVVNENICRDGRRVWMAWTNKPVYDEHGQVSEILAVGGDITSRKRIEDELRRSNAELEQFAYIASHDLQEPLRTVAGMVQLLQKRYQGQLDERADEYIHFGVDAADRMQQLINDLLDFSRVDRKEISYAPTNMEKVLQTALSNLQSAITESAAQITFDPLPTVQADAEQLTQVLQNLVGNAIKFRSEQPLEVHISAAKLENGWQFAVRDNGIGIDPHYFERVFLIFQRLHTRRKYPGTGIGLAICRKIIERHGGKIWIESELNRGATFFFTLPERSQA